MGYRPFALTIEDPEIAYDFYAGNMVLIAFIEIDVLLARFRSRGLNATYLTDDDWCISAVVTFDNGSTSEMRIGTHIFGRLFYEFLSLEWFVEENIPRSRLSPDEYKTTTATDSTETPLSEPETP
jgi:hypothetical protein